jgi:hypothetical protein
VLLLFEESPRYLYTKKLYREARATLKKIARFNGVKYDDDFVFDDEVKKATNNRE